jgi:acyl-CoA synthetase (AMP-forming)/AMP-acid ligase II/thioesterase domain-containing protein/acyl carrier protein
LHDLVAAQAAARPHAPAILGLERAPLTYARLLELIEQTIQALRAAGLGREDRVAAVLSNGPEAATAFAAVASGAIFAPLNPSYSRDEFEFFLNDLRAKALIVEEGSESAAVRVARERAIPLILLRRKAGAEAGFFTLEHEGPSPAASGGLPQASDVALMLHTSGTTSRPKMAPLRHSNLCASARNIQRSLALTGEDRCLNIMPLFHIHGLAGALLSSLAAGGSVVCTPGFNAPKFFERVDTFRPTWYTAVPTMHQAILARAGENREITGRRPFRLIRSSSSALPPQVMAGLEAAFGAPVIESYGMTEAAHQMASNPLPPAARKPGSVGLAAGPEVAVMDEQGNLAGAGVTGELVIRGSNVMLGYEGPASINQAAFSNGWFRTGDQGYIDEQGYIFLTGRLKELINRGGEKISPRQIDEVLLDHASIAQALAFSIPHAQLGEEIGVAVVLRDGAALSAIQVREFAAARLAAFKVPKVVKFVKEIPKGPTGKLQRIGLAAKLGIEPLSDAPATRAAKPIPPRTELEGRMAAIWREILDRDGIGTDDDFFELGGDSMLASMAVARSCRELAVELSMLEFLDHPTIAGLAAHLKSSQGEGLVPIQPHGSGTPLFFAAAHNGNLAVAGRLARYLGPDRPIFAFPPPALENEDAVFDIETLAARYIDILQAARPGGPYLLAGQCFGGLVAFEMAHRLRENGADVALLALLDCFNPRCAIREPRVKWMLRKLRTAGRRIAIHLEYLDGHPAEEGIRYLLGRTRALEDRLHEEAERPREATARYVPKPYAGPMLLLGREDRYPDSPLFGWQDWLTGPVEAHHLPYHQFGLSAESVMAVAGPLFAARLNGV